MPLLYDREAAVAYAHRWAMGRNPAYLDFHGIGGDCTNFISQCLKAGGSPQNYTKDTGWYYISASNRAAAWTSVVQLYRFLTANEQTGPKARVVPIAQVQPGDVIQLAFSPDLYGHSLMVVQAGVPAVPQTVLVATHTFDADNRPLASYSYYSFRCLHIRL